MAVKADRYYTIQKAECWNNNRHGGPVSWIVTMDGSFDKPHVFETLAKACEWVAQFSEPAKATASESGAV